MGYGTRAIELLAKYYQGEIVSLSENEKEEEEEAEEAEQQEGKREDSTRTNLY